MRQNKKISWLSNSPSVIFLSAQYSKRYRESSHCGPFKAEYLRRPIRKSGGRRSFPTNEKFLPSRTSASVRDGFRSLSLVFICRENPRRSGILLFPDRPRFCRLMKTRNRRNPRSSGMNGDKSGESGAFLFFRRVPDFCDGRRSFPTNVPSGTLASVGDGFRSLPIP